MKEGNHKLNINPALLIWARETIVLSKFQASIKSQISVQRITQLELGEDAPTIDELKSLSKIYKRTVATLLLSLPPEEKPLPIDRRTIDSLELGIFHVKTIMAVRKARALTQSYIELKRELGITINMFSDRALISDSPSECANAFRKKYGFDAVREIAQTDEALKIYLEAIGALGIAVFQLSLNQDGLRGFSILDEDVPVIVIKRGEPATAKTFTLFHELAHILLNEGGMCDMSHVSSIAIEKWCNAFAAEMLVPIQLLLNIDLVKQKTVAHEKLWSKSELIKIGSFFHVGPLVILRRLLDQGKTTREFYNEMHQKWSQSHAYGKGANSEGRNIPKEALNERGRDYVSLAFSAFDKNRIDIKSLSDFLGIKLVHIPKTRQLLNA